MADLSDTVMRANREYLRNTRLAIEMRKFT